MPNESEAKGNSLGNTMDDRADVEVEIRRLRKKLRQIERLELCDRDINDAEALKIASKDDIRERLLELLTENGLIDPNNGAPLISDSSILSTDSESPSLPSTPQHVTQYDQPQAKQARYDEPLAEYEEEYEAEPGAFITSQALSHDAEPHASSHDAEFDTEIPEEEPTTSNYEQLPPTAEDEASQAATPPAKTSKSKSKAEKKQKAKEKEHKAKEKEQPKPRKPLTKSDIFRQHDFRVIELEGHNDMVGALATDGEYIVSGSRDTTVKVWKICTGEELHNLGSHTMTVTSVVVICKEHAPGLWEEFAIEDKDKIIISGSQDCSIKYWSLLTGKLLKSVYTFNPVTCLCLPAACKEMLLLGTAGGKLELWNLTTGCSVHSLTAHEDALTVLHASGGLLYSASDDGDVQVFEIRENQLHCMFVSENISSVNGVPLPQRPIRAMSAIGDSIYYGDDGPNVKALHWKSGSVRKLGNHLIEFGYTDVLCCYGDMLVSSGYNIDQGLAYINVRSLADESYLGTLNDGDTGRIMTMTCCNNSSGELCLVTGGTELKVWRQMKQRTKSDDVFAVQYIDAYNIIPDDSEPDSESEWSEHEDELTARRRHKRSYIEPEDTDEPGGWWCTLL